MNKLRVENCVDAAGHGDGTADREAGTLFCSG